MRKEGWEWTLSAAPASVYHLCSEPVNPLKLTYQGGHEDLRGHITENKKARPVVIWARLAWALGVPVPVLRTASFPQMAGPDAKLHCAEPAQLLESLR